MKAPSSILAAIWVLLSAGCATQDSAKPTGLASSDVKVQTVTCRFATKEMTCPDSVLSGRRCVVDVSVDAQNNVTIAAETIKVTAATKIVWRLADGSFIAAKGDGVFIKDRSDDKDQFTDGNPTDDEQGQNRRKRAKHFKWYFENSQTGSFEYLIRFHKSGKVFVCDPYINNEGAGG